MGSVKLGDGLLLLVADFLIEWQVNLWKQIPKVLVPRRGHLHMNQLKTSKVMDYKMLEPLGKKALHFNSPKAY